MLHWIVSKAFTREDDLGAEELVARRPAIELVQLTPEGAQRLRGELEGLQQRRDAVLAQSQTTATRHELETLDRRLRELRLTLASATVVVPTQQNLETVRFGATVLVRDCDGEQTYRIVGPAEADPARGWITAASPLGQALLNKKAGEKVLFRFPAGEDTLEILAVSY